MIIHGSVEDIIFRNEDNGYSVINIDYNHSLLTCVGKAVSVNIGEEVELSGEFVENAKFGKQFAFSTLAAVEPKSKEGIKKYLASGLIDGVGPATAEKIVEHFGKDSLEIISFAPIRLSEIRGISKKKALSIGESFNEKRNVQNAVMFLQKYNISLTLSLKIFNFYKDRTVSIVSENPYRLVEDIDGIGFLTADKIAISMGIPSDSDFRVRAGILHVLGDASDKNGHTYLPKDTLLESIKELLKIDEVVLNKLFEEELEKLQIESRIKVFELKDEECVCLKTFYFMESSIAGKLILSDLSELDTQVDVETEIKEYERINKIVLHDTQKEAIKSAVKGQVTVITGGPGTGKTTIVKCILSCCKNYTNKIYLLAPTGRASKRLTETCRYEASTIHRALEVTYKDGEKPVFKYNEKNKLRADVVIVDEMSMVDVYLFSSLLRALPSTCKLILVGDKDQLPSVGAGNVLRDIIESKVINTVKLTHIYRQDDKSLIVSNAHLINEGKMPDLTNKSNDFFYENRQDLDNMFETVVDLVTRRLPKYAMCDSSDIQVLCAMRSGICGVENLNRRLQELINPPSLKKREIVFETRTLREGDKVMQVINDYDLKWTKVYDDGRIEEGEGIFNGDMGKIIKIDYQTSEATVWFDDDRMAVYSKVQASELFVCYATTIHKSQGSEFDVVVVPVVSGAPNIVTRNLLYTAVTRAKKIVVLVGPKKNILRMIYNNNITRRYTMLGELLKLQKQKAENIYGE